MKFYRHNPYQHNLLPIANLTGFLLISLGISYIALRMGFITAFFPIMGAVLAGIFLLILLVVWGIGAHQNRQARSFFESDRPLIRWQLSSSAQQPLKDKAFEQSRGMWKFQMGCLTVLLAISGFLTGFMLDMEISIGQGFLSGMIGFAVGAAAGAVIGGLVGLGNQIAARLALHSTTPYQVALGINEVYVDGHYFRGDQGERQVLSVVMDSTVSDQLKITLNFPNRVRLNKEEVWTAIVPAHLSAELQELLPDMHP